MAKKELTAEEKRILVEFGARIKNARLRRRRESGEKNWSQMDLASKAGFLPNRSGLRRIQAIEAGEHNVSFSVAVRVVKALGHSLSTLYGSGKQTKVQDEPSILVNLRDLMEADEDGEWIDFAQKAITHALDQARRAKKPRENFSGGG